MDMVATTSEMLMLSPAMVTVAIAGQATHTMDMVATTSEMLMLSLAMEVMVMEATPGSAMATDMVMATVATAMVAVAIAGQATPTMDMVATTSEMLMLSRATEATDLGATPTCTDLPRDLVDHMDTIEKFG